MYHQHIFPLVFADIIDQFGIPTDTQFYNMQNQFSHYMYMYMQTWICSLSCEIQTVNVYRLIVAHCIFAFSLMQAISLCFKFGQKWLFCLKYDRKNKSTSFKFTNRQ